MRRIILAMRVFFSVLFNAAVARGVGGLLESPEAAAIPSPKVAEKPAPAKKIPPPAKEPVRSEALTLLATLQREARLVDFVKEPLEGYADAQIGAAAREVHRGCAKVLERLFALRPVVTEGEGTEMQLPAGFDTGRFRLVGNVGGEPPLVGQVVHQGWEATTCELPVWQGSATSARVVAPAEVEVK